jgi:methionyl-tRNA synthetase|tara:strand:- start:37 stop:366 length:330 start_codon:yes stop_codon:yes gene_type:complete
MTNVKFDEWSKLDLKVGTILEVEDHPNADKLYVLKVDIGSEKPTTLVAGIKNHYSMGDLIGKKIIVFTNLEPVELRGVKSEGMLLAASKKDNVVLLGLDKDIDNGAKIS